MSGTDIVFAVHDVFSYHAEDALRQFLVGVCQQGLSRRQWLRILGKGTGIPFLFGHSEAWVEVGIVLAEFSLSFFVAHIEGAAGVVRQRILKDAFEDTEKQRRWKKVYHEHSEHNTERDVEESWALL